MMNHHRTCRYGEKYERENGRTYPVESQINAVEEGFVNSQIMHLNIGLLNP